MASRKRLVLTLVSAIALAAVFVSAGSSSATRHGAVRSHAALKARSATPGQAAMPTVYVNYAMNCTFSLSDDDGKKLTSIAPGTYQVYVSTPVMFKLVHPGGAEVDNVPANDFSGCKGWVQFSLTGPGVNLSTTLDSGCDAFLLLPAQTFKANQTYVFQDLNQPALTRTALTVAATGTPWIPASPYGATSGPGTTQQDYMNSLGAVRGTVNGSLSSDGVPSLAGLKGRPLTSLKTGRYKFTIIDKDPTRGFSIRSLGVNDGSGATSPTTKGKDLTGTKFVGKHSVTVTLRVGRWMYYSGTGKSYYLQVTA